MRILTLQLKIIIIFAILIIVALGGGYFYLTKMKVVSFNININKSNSIDRLRNYSIYSDFYYRVVDYAQQNSYAEMVPVKTNICYDFKNNKVDLETISNGNKMILDDQNGNNIESYITLLDGFIKDYGKIVATQDKDYFDKSYQRAKQIYKSLYQEDITISKIDPIQKMVKEL
jgi:predicted MPP superfamily phosphohydrolase